MPATHCPPLQATSPQEAAAPTRVHLHPHEPVDQFQQLPRTELAQPALRHERRLQCRQVARRHGVAQAVAREHKRQQAVGLHSEAGCGALALAAALTRCQRRAEAVLQGLRGLGSRDRR